MKMESQSKETQATQDLALDRRSFLRAGLGASAVTAVVSASTATPALATESDAEKKKARYRETDHVKTYYRTNRY